MKKCKMKRKGNNKGFSLIECLLAVVLLGLIAAPLLQMFYSSMAMNSKSKKYLAASDLAQTKMEEISARTWEDSEPIMTGASSLAGVTDGLKNTYFSPTETDFTTPITGVTMDYGGYDFEWELTFDVPDNAGSKKYYSVKATIVVKDYDSKDVLSTVFTEIPNKH